MQVVAHKFGAQDFVGGHLALDLVNTVTAWDTQPRDRLPDFSSLLNWAALSGAFHNDDLTRLDRMATRNAARAAAALRRAKALRSALHGVFLALAAGIGLAGPVSDADLDRLVAFYDERGGAARIEVAPFVPESLIAGLGARGFRLRRFENVLARELAADDDLRGLLTHGWPSGLEVRPPHADEVEAFVIASEAGFLEPGQRIDPADLEVGVRMVSHPRVHSFCAVVDGEIVGASSMEVDGEIAGLFGTSVYEAYRRRGIQQALLVGVCR